MIRFPDGPKGRRAEAVYQAVRSAAQRNPYQAPILPSTAIDITNLAIAALDDGGWLAPLEQGAAT